MSEPHVALTRAQICQLLGVTPQTVWHWRVTGKLPAEVTLQQLAELCPLQIRTVQLPSFEPTVARTKVRKPRFDLEDTEEH